MLDYKVRTLLHNTFTLCEILPYNMLGLLHLISDVPVLKAMVLTFKFLRGCTQTLEEVFIENM